jgi:hypothetical protein
MTPEREAAVPRETLRERLLEYAHVIESRRYGAVKPEAFVALLREAASALPPSDVTPEGQREP